MKTQMLQFLSRMFAATMIGRVCWEMDVRYNGFVAFMEGARVLVEYTDEFYVEIKIPAISLELSASSRIVAPRRLGLLWWAAWRNVESRNCLLMLEGGVRCTG